MKRLLVLFVLSVWLPWAGAASLDLYTTEVLVLNQSAAERSRAASAGLGELLVRVSGDRSALEHPAVKRALGQAQNYLQEFSYASTQEQIELDSGEWVPARRLLLRFSPQAVQDLLRGANLPLWPANRPSLLVWLVVNDAAGIMLVSDRAEYDSLRAQAQRRGLPLITPLMDLEDRLALSGRDLWHLDEAVIRQASARYRADAILVGRYSPTSSGEWRSGWQLLHSMGNPVFDSQQATVDALLSDAIDHVADHLAQLYAIIPREEGPDALVLQVGGIEDFAAFKGLQRYLEGLAMVRRTEVVAARQDGLLVRLYAEGGVERLLQALARDQRLLEPRQAGVISLPESRYLPQGTLANPLVYSWQP